MSDNTEVKIYKSAYQVCIKVAEEMLNLTRSSKQPVFNISLSGGNTPQNLFQVLAEVYFEDIPWKRIHFWWGDERCVPPDNHESNFKMAHDFLFSKVNVPAENIHRIRGEDNPEKEAERYSGEIKKYLNFRGENPVFDLILLGLGIDGHTASIFPDQIELFEDNRFCAATIHPLSRKSRITLTGKALNNASLVFFIVTGGGKAQRVSEIMNNEEAAKLLPAYYISPKNGKLVWFLDENAAIKII